MRLSRHWAKQQMVPALRTKSVSVIAELGLVFISVTMLSWLLVTFAGRVGYPYDLEWMEGGMLVHGHRVLNGEGLYVPPSLDFIPYIYPPLYSWVLAAFGAVFGLWACRLLAPGMQV